MWLLSKGQNQEALKSLCWLRGWVEGKAVATEFQSFVKYNELSQRPVTRDNDKIYKQVPTKAYSKWFSREMTNFVGSSELAYV